MPRAAAVAALKPKRIRKKPAVLNPTYASLKTGSQQKNPIVFVAYGTNIHVMRKLFFTEELELPSLVTVNIDEAERVIAKLNSMGARVDERAQEAILSKNDMEQWRLKFNVYDHAGMYVILTQRERDLATLYHAFKLRPGPYLPSPIATVEPHAATFWHKQRNRFESVHVRVEFTGSIQSSHATESASQQHQNASSTTAQRDGPDFRNYVPRPSPYITADQMREQLKIVTFNLHNPPSPDMEFYTRERIYVAFDGNVYCIPKLALTEESTPPSVLTIDMDEIRHIVDTVRPMGVHIDERVRQASLHSTKFNAWKEINTICEDTSIYNALTSYSRDLVSIYYLFKKATLELKPMTFARNIPRGATTFISPSKQIESISCTISFIGKDPFEEDTFLFPQFTDDSYF